MLPDTDCVEFHELAIDVPAGRVSCTRHEVIADELSLVTVTRPSYPLFHELTTVNAAVSALAGRATTTVVAAAAANAAAAIHLILRKTGSVT